MKKSPASSLNLSEKAKRDAMMECRNYFMGIAKKTMLKKKKKKLPQRRSVIATSSTRPTNSSDASWVRSRLLGKGGFGSVYLAVRDNGEEIAIKTAEILHASTLMDESRILSGLGCPFVVSCLGDEITTESDTGKRYYNLKLEFCSGRSLADFIQNRRPDGLRESDVKILATDILKGLNHIHCHQIIHCDIKPDNILLVPQVKWLRPDWYVAKIADFGLAVEKDSVEYQEEKGFARGTTMYMSPELAADGVLDYGVDVWAFGCTVLEMLTGSHAWGQNALLDRNDLMALIGFSDQIPVIPDSVSQEAKDFLEKCFVTDPATRWTTDALLRHPFLDSRT